MCLRVMGSILLITGTSIGAGLLALPIATADGGFINTTVLLFVCWLSMTLGAFCILEVTLRLPPNNNLISMAGKTLGPLGQTATWIVYLLLLYALLSAYISGGTDLIHHLLARVFRHEANWLDTLIFTLVLGAIVVCGMKSVDWANRGLMIAKLSIFIFLIIAVVPKTQTQLLFHSTLKPTLSAAMVAITSFGFAIIIPSLRVYLKGNARHLRIAVTTGSFIALICYWFWCLSIQGSIPLPGAQGLTAIAHSKTPITGMTTRLSHLLHRHDVTVAISVFAAISILTSFLAVSLSLTDFLADGLKREKKGKNSLLIYGLTFFPPLMIVIADPGIFIAALKYAGIFCVLLLILLPALMAYRLRQKQANTTKKQSNNIVIYVTLLLAVLLLGLGIGTL